MKKPTPISGNKKSRGRPRTTGTGTLVGVRLHPPILGAIDNWRRSEQDLPTRSEAIRRLVEQVLGGKRKR
jgi:hypothetical protein